jgi:hypothetical protein
MMDFPADFPKSVNQSPNPEFERPDEPPPPVMNGWSDVKPELKPPLPKFIPVLRPKDILFIGLLLF